VAWPHQQLESGECIFLHILHIKIMIAYIVYSCIFCAYFLYILIEDRYSQTLHIFAYLLHISCILYAYLCIFLHIS
jgi:hypothetical protein